MTRLIFTLTILLFIAFGACKKASGPANGKSVQPNNNLDSTVSISAEINKVKWQSDSAFGYFVKTSVNDSGMVNLLIIATKKGSVPTTMSFEIYNFIGPNTYLINPPVNTAIYYIGNNRHYAIQGQITIASDTAFSLRGTFSFVADTITVTNGEFDVAMP